MKISLQKYQTGLSLIELLLAMFVSLVILQQAHQLLLTLINNYAQLEQGIEGDEGKQIALLILKHFVSLGGYEEFSSTNTNSSIFIQDNNFKEGTFVFGLNNVSNNSGIMKNSDVLMVRFHTPNNLQMRDCKNTLLDADKNYTLDFYIDRNADFRCKGAASSNHVRNSAVLAHGISDFQVEYAYRSAGDLKFCDAACINSESMWNQIVALRFVLKNSNYNKSTSEEYSKSIHTVYFDNAPKY